MTLFVPTLPMGRHSSEQTFRDDSNLFTSTRTNSKRYITTSCDWINILPWFSQSIAVVPFIFPRSTPVLWISLIRRLIGSLDDGVTLWLVNIITLCLEVQQSIKNHSKRTPVLGKLLLVVFISFRQNVFINQRWFSS